MTAQFHNPYNRKPFCVHNLKRIYSIYCSGNNDSGIISVVYDGNVIRLDRKQNFIHLIPIIQKVVKEEAESTSLQEYLMEQIDEIIKNNFMFVLNDDITSSEFCFMLCIMNTQERSLELRTYIEQIVYTVNNVHEIKAQILESIETYRKETICLFNLHDSDDYHYYYNILVFIEEIIKNDLDLVYYGL